jgi:hypothetical protein
VPNIDLKKAPESDVSSSPDSLDVISNSCSFIQELYFAKSSKLFFKDMNYSEYCIRYNAADGVPSDARATVNSLAMFQLDACIFANFHHETKLLFQTLRQ